MAIVPFKILVITVGFFCFLYFLYNKKITQQQSKNKLLKQEPIRTLSQVEADILQHYLGFKAIVGMPVYSLAGFCYKHKSETKPFAYYYTIDDVRIILFDAMLDVIDDYNQTELVLVNNKAIVICINDFTLPILKQHIDNNKFWLDGHHGRYYSPHYSILEHKMASAMTSEMTNEVEFIELRQNIIDKFSYFISSNYQASKREIKQCRRYSWLNCLISMSFLLLSGISVICYSYCDTLLGSYISLAFTAMFIVIACFFLYKEKSKLQSNKVNLVKGRITAIDRDKYQLRLNHYLELHYPMYWNEFIVIDENKDVTLEVMADSHYIVAYNNQLSINSERKFGRFYPWFNKVIKAGFAFIMLLFFVGEAVTPSKYGFENLLAIKPMPDISAYVNVPFSSSDKFLDSLRREHSPISILNVPGLCIYIENKTCRELLLINEVPLKKYVSQFDEKNNRLIKLYFDVLNNQLFKFEIDNHEIERIANSEEVYQKLNKILSSVSYNYSELAYLLEDEIKQGYLKSKQYAQKIITESIGHLVIDKLFGLSSPLPKSIIIKVEDDSLANSMSLFPMNTDDVDYSHFLINFYQALHNGKVLTTPISIKGSLKNVKKEYRNNQVITIWLSPATEAQLSANIEKQYVSYYKIYIISALKLLFQLFVCYQLFTMVYIACQNASVAFGVKNHFKTLSRQN